MARSYRLEIIFPLELFVCIAILLLRACALVATNKLMFDVNDSSQKEHVHFIRGDAAKIWQVRNTAIYCLMLENASSDWIAGFCTKIGLCSPPEAEMWGLLYGLQIAWGNAN
ncbi:conserved hypothetical protein [Ricinus communis]|uniref:RNase H type-1 domain-containing protein n=1 Tax=Ricinus communis TaxID=3988 RepID=B9SYH3_RICCO|nr:conserved hypothetical protein [Ricinus communis]